MSFLTIESQNIHEVPIRTFTYPRFEENVYGFSIRKRWQPINLTLCTTGDSPVFNWVQVIRYSEITIRNEHEIWTFKNAFLTNVNYRNVVDVSDVLVYDLSFVFEDVKLSNTENMSNYDYTKQLLSKI